MWSKKENQNHDSHLCICLGNAPRKRKLNQLNEPIEEQPHRSVIFVLVSRKRIASVIIVHLANRIACCGDNTCILAPQP
jgi:hypothetical protein